jgi:hypothetical protein
MKKLAKKSSLKRAINPMAANIRTLLVKNGLLESYKARPAYQQNDYLSWIAQAKLDATKEKRTKQMLTELRRGNVYMNMAWRRTK